MRQLLSRLWNDEHFFLRWCSVAVFVAGTLIASGSIPTFVDGLGPKLGPIVQAVAVAIATGKLQLPRGAEATTTTAVVAPPNIGPQSHA